VVAAERVQGGQPEWPGAGVWRRSARSGQDIGRAIRQRQRHSGYRRLAWRDGYRGVNDKGSGAQGGERNHGCADGQRASSQVAPLRRAMVNAGAPGAPAAFGSTKLSPLY
jgi:hypothetical protein